MTHLGKTPAFRDAHGRVLPGSIATVAYESIGGVEQWVMLRGENVQNPALVLLHGGPGMSETGFFRHFCAPLEKHFTLVYWDQRGAGKSFDVRTPAASLTAERFVADLDELIDIVLRRLGKTSVAIFGHSWGSALGVLYAGRFPRKVSAYIGSGQIGDWARAEAATYAFTLAEAERRGNRAALRDLRRIGPPPHSAKDLWVQRTWLSRFEGRMRPPALWKMLRAMLSGSESSVLDLYGAMRGMRFSLDATWREVSRMNLHTLVPALEMPVFLLLGRKDHWVFPEVSVAYLEALRAPSKRIVWFEQSGHEPFMDEPEAFNRAMIEVVRPAVIAALRS